DTSHITPYIVDYKNAAGIPPMSNLPFNFLSVISGLGYRYFEVAYDTIKNNYTLRVTVSIKTQKCVMIHSYSYFKIIDGTFGINWKPAGISMEDRVPLFIIYPNPTENLVNFVWEGP